MFVQKSQITSAVPSLFISGQRPHPCWIGPPGQTRTPAGLNIAQLTRKYCRVQVVSARGPTVYSTAIGSGDCLALLATRE